MIISADQAISIRTTNGAAVVQAMPITSIRWGCEARQTTKCQVSVDPLAGADIMPWGHWLDVWVPESAYPVWSGPIIRTAIDRNSAEIAAHDPSVYARRTRCPITKDWDSTSPTKIAAELWKAMLAVHGIDIEPVTLAGVDTTRVADGHGDHVDFSVTADESMMTSVFERLVQVGLQWSVVGGVPFLGVMPRQPVTTLGERDFLDDSLKLVRDGTNTYNDVVVRAADTIARGRTPIGNLTLQALVHLDDMFGVSNAQAAARTYLAYMGRIRDEIQVPAGIKLSPDAPVLLEQLVPTTRMVVEAFNVATLSELTSMQVSVSAGQCDVAVSLAAAHDDLPELAKIDGGDS